MVKPVVMFNPPPGWVVQEPGFVASMSWQPPAEWPPLPAGWPLFVEFRRWPMWTAFWASMVCLGVPIRWMLLKVDSHAVDVGLGFAAVYLLSFLIAQRFLMLRPRAVPPARWPWVPAMTELHTPTVARPFPLKGSGLRAWRAAAGGTGRQAACPTRRRVAAPPTGGGYLEHKKHNLPREGSVSCLG